MMKATRPGIVRQLFHEGPSRENQTGLSLEAQRPSRNTPSNEASRRSTLTAVVRLRPRISSANQLATASHSATRASGQSIRLALPFPRKSPQPTTCELTAHLLLLGTTIA